VASLFLHRVPGIAPQNNFDNVQLMVSKVLIFGVLSFVLFLAARSYLAQKHNAIVSRHRQEALQTYQALVDAAGDEANRDIILTHAAACIFGPQPTGYSQDSSANTPSAKSVVELLGSSVAKGHGTS
jgi:type II secretory pathway pseudopilin PulG